VNKKNSKLFRQGRIGKTVEKLKYNEIMTAALTVFIRKLYGLYLILNKRL